VRRAGLQLDVSFSKVRPAMLQLGVFFSKARLAGLQLPFFKTFGRCAMLQLAVLKTFGGRDVQAEAVPFCVMNVSASSFSFRCFSFYTAICVLEIRAQIYEKIAYGI
jgi:hypothetical protein